MIFEETILKGAFVIKPEKKEDNRGFFARTFCRREFAEHGLRPVVVQCNISFNLKRGTFRGMHFQTAPYEEDKIVSCIKGAFLDVIVDLRPGSPTFRKSIQVHLSQENGFSLYVPKSFAHGLFTLVDLTEVFYQMTGEYCPGHEAGFRYDDPSFDIRLPFDVAVIAERDKNYPDLFKKHSGKNYQLVKPVAHSMIRRSSRRLTIEYGSIVSNSGDNFQ